ncbi:hypothetical protein ACL02R_17770 [Streptomyces sp. MS19]|uniref:hypothetical protein n=1 Tax=Streptomyces sp. MS19 TaxID=3385972 RepID=UPI0039A1099E
MRRLVAVLATVAAAAALTGTAAPGASAGGASAAAEYGCNGSLINTYPVRTPAGAVWGNIRLYYDGSTGRNCAVNVKTAAGGSGTRGWTSVNLYRCASSTPGRPCRWQDETYDGDGGPYAYYAGPVSIPAAGKCIRVTGFVGTAPSNASGGSGTNGVHCG